MDVQLLSVPLKAMMDSTVGPDAASILSHIPDASRIRSVSRMPLFAM